MKEKNLNVTETVITPNFAYIMGLVGGDGTITENPKTGEYRISIIDNCFEFHQKVIKPKMEKIFPGKIVISGIKTRKGRLTYRTRLCSKQAIEVFKRFNIPLKNKTYAMKTPKPILNSSREIIKEYIKGWILKVG